MLGNTNVNIVFNVTGNANENLSKITGNIRDVTGQATKSASTVNKLGESFFVFNQIAQGIGQLNNELNNAIAPGIKYQDSMADLSAITGITGQGLDEIGKKARENAKMFGGEASDSVESYKLLLSQLGPELAKTPEALSAMGKNVSILSKTMGGDTKAATEVLTTAMNQYQVSLDDPIKASKEMADMMNIMSAAAKEGSAELPVIKSALEQSGMAAKLSGVQFSELNASIQVLDQAGKKGAEGGVALRNIMLRLSRGRFLPKQVQEELTSAGVDIERLGDKTLSLTERMRPLQGIMDDTALMAKFFGDENSNAALALLSGLDQVDQFNVAIQETNTAYDQAAIKMDTYSEKMDRLNAWFSDIKIGIFNAMEPMLPFTQMAGDALETVAKLGNAVKGVSILMDTKLMASLKKSIIGFGRFITKTILATKSIGIFATKGLLAGLQALGTYILSLVTGGGASVVFAATSKLSFAVFKKSAVSACRKVSLAISSIPIIGWIAGAITLVIIFWDKIKAFFIMLGQWFADIFNKIIGWVKPFLKKIKDFILKYNFWTLLIEGIDKIFPGFKAKLKDMVDWIYENFIEPIVNGVKKILSFFGLLKKETENKGSALVDFGKIIETMSVEEQQKWLDKYNKKNNTSYTLEQAMYMIKKSKTNPLSMFSQSGGVSGVVPDYSGGVDKIDNTIKGGEGIKNINISIGKLVETISVSQATMEESIEEFANKVKQVLLQAVNDANYA